jgi:CP family cyanate transporter-like MFS transporter
MREELQLDHAVVGLFVTVPLFAMGFAALLAPAVVRWIGPRGALTVGLLTVAALGVLRVLPDDFVYMVALSLPMGIAVGIGSAGLPLAIRAYLPAAPATATSVYALGIYVGAMVGAAAAVPLSVALGGWRLALLSLTLGTLAAAAVWHRLASRARSGPETATATTVRSWLIPGLGSAIAVYAIRSAIFQGYSAWLPSMYVEKGWSAQAAGALLAVLIGAGAVAVLIAGPLADWRGSRRLHLSASAALLLIGGTGLILWPGLALVWAAVTGLAIGAQFTVALTLPLDLATSRASLVAAAAIVVGIGSLVGSVAPTALGALRDGSGTFTISSWVLVGLSALLLLTAVAFRHQSSAAQDTSGNVVAPSPSQR